MTVYISPNPGKEQAADTARRAAQLLLMQGAVVLMQEVIQQMLLLYFLVAEIVCGLFQVLYSLQRFLCEFTNIHNRLPPYLFGC